MNTRCLVPLLMLAFFACAIPPSSVRAEEPASPPQPYPFGVCAHLARGDEYGEFVRELDLMKAAGIRWVRTDFTWGYFEPREGQFRFDRYDEVVDAAKARGIEVLPILCYDSPWAGFAHEHPEAWARFVRTVAGRYGGRLRYWEVWNEPNIGFWKPKPDPAQYTKLLKLTWETLKAADPGLQVVYGGTAGIPLDFIGRTLELGASRYFDVMAVHPYSYPELPEDSGRLEELRRLKTLLAEHGATGRIWITETGWPTHRDDEAETVRALQADLVEAAARRARPGRNPWRVAVVADPAWDKTHAAARQFAAALHGRSNFVARTVPLEVLDRLDRPCEDVLVGLLGEQVPAAAIPALKRYVEAGGLLVHFGGVPMYYTLVEEKPGGPLVSKGADGALRDAFRIGWQASWTKPGLPESATHLVAASGVDSLAVPPCPMATRRWYDASRLREGDRFEPLLSALRDGKDVGCAAGLYRYGDRPGAVLVCDLWLQRTRGVSEAEQAVMVTRAVPVYLKEGVEVFFWYEFRDGGSNPAYNEHRFGLVREDLSPKPAYDAFRALTGGW